MDFLSFLICGNPNRPFTPLLFKPINYFFILNFHIIRKNLFNTCNIKTTSR